MRSKVAEKILNETPEDVRIFVRQYTNIVIRIHELMRLRGFTQKDLALRMNKKPSEINKWLKGNHNLTLRTIAKLEAELGDSIIYTVDSKNKKQPA
jgi:transcriptional regulator with XRE-family HTH domain